MLWEDENLDNTRMGITAGVAVVLFAIATLLGLQAAGNNVIDADVRIGVWVQQWQGPLPEMLESIGDMSGETITAIVAVIGAIAIAIYARAWRIVAFLVVVGVFRMLGMILKPYFESPRPSSSQVRIYEYSDGFGYPSGHSMTAAMIATMAVLIAWNTRGIRRYRWPVTGSATALALLVGWSRVWGGAHWPTDVIGGWSYGVGLVLVAWAVTTRVAHSRTG